jgi:hypothetical protein
MQRTLKAETTRPPDQTMDRQQKLFDAFAMSTTRSVRMKHSAKAAGDDLPFVATSVSRVAAADPVPGCVETRGSAGRTT